MLNVVSHQTNAAPQFGMSKVLNDKDDQHWLDIYWKKIINSPGKGDVVPVQHWIDAYWKKIINSPGIDSFETTTPQ